MDRERQVRVFWTAMIYVFGATAAGLLLYKGYPEIEFLSNMIFG